MCSMFTHDSYVLFMSYLPAVLGSVRQTYVRDYYPYLSSFLFLPANLSAPNGKTFSVLAAFPCWCFCVFWYRRYRKFRLGKHGWELSRDLTKACMS